MDLIIDGHKAVLKEGSSFDYVAENRSFTDADAYTFSISLPLAGCAENLEIFGHLDRMDFDNRHLVFEASIVDIGFAKNGVVVVVEATDVECKVQFLEGRSVQNYMTTFDDIYINELNIEHFGTSDLPTKPSYINLSIDDGVELVALPWVYDETGDIQNESIWDSKAGELVWGQDTIDTGKLSNQMYLLPLTKLICNKLGYSFDFQEWEQSADRHLLVCNSLPAAWEISDLARALPHWSVTEFFENLESLLAAEIDIDHKSKHITFTYCSGLAAVVGEVNLDNIVDEFTAEVSKDDELGQFKGVANVRYKDRDDEDWKNEQCQWLIDLFKAEGKYYKEFENWGEMIMYVHDEEEGDPVGGAMSEDVKHVRRGCIYYVRNLDTYYTYKYYPTGDTTCWPESIMINRLAEFIADPDSDNEIEVACLPVRIALTDGKHGWCMFLTPSGFSEDGDVDDNEIRQPIAYSALMKGNKSEQAEYYDTLYLAYFGTESVDSTGYQNSGDDPPCPIVDSRFSLKNRYSHYMGGIKIDPRERLKVSWISSTIPDVRAVYNIRGRRCLCEKITATFTEDGMSQLLKGDFYPVVD